MSFDCEVAIVGAGAAGLTALRELDRAGCEALCLEARQRIGGRIFTVHDALSPLPIELGAEFIHGRPPEIWNIVNAAPLTAYDCGDTAVRLQNGQVQDEQAWDTIERVMADMRLAAAHGPDRPFSEFLANSVHTEEAKLWAAGYVEGFNAARQEIIGIASLAQDAAASEKIDGGRAFRLMNGYQSVPLHLLAGVVDSARKLRLNSIVETIVWQAGAASLHVRHALTGNLKVIRCRRVVITVPLGVLQAENGIHFQPEPGEVLQAARRLAVGHVLRVALRFRRAFWEENEDISFAGFLLSDEAVFPTWWTPLSVRAPLITGWSAGPHADPLLGKPHAHVVSEAIAALTGITRADPARVADLLEAAYFHDWHADSFARGAYSYAPAHALPAREILAAPVADTLYFAGEATELNGHSATVHGAIASGERVAQRILSQRR
ncbi:MAG TPA: NAD(P)/FAD-dependent oxidoreductase [Bryobacteraceae bacterium]|nr:NAD(P)/FAD-dependent oxidoreductase [Bryobacteraceae bacterium]